MKFCLTDDVEAEEEDEGGDDNDNGDGEQRGRVGVNVGVEDIPLVVGAPSDRFHMGTSPTTKQQRTLTHHMDFRQLYAILITPQNINYYPFQLRLPPTTNNFP